MIFICRDTARCWGPEDARLIVLSTMLFENDDGASDVPDCMRENKLEYARMHGYRYCEYTDGLAPEGDLAARRRSANQRVRFSFGFQGEDFTLHLSKRYLVL